MAAGEQKLKLVLDAIDKTAAPIRKVNRRIESMTRPIRKVKRALRSLAIESGLPKLGTAFKSVGRIARNFALAGVAAGVGLFEFVRRTASSSEELAKLGRQLGISTTEFQELKFAADRVGVSSSDFTKGIGALGKRVGELKADTGPLATLLKKVSPALAVQLKGATDTGEALNIMLAALGRLEDPLKKNALAAAAFGRAGQSMVRLSNEGAESIGNLREEARRLGGVLDLEAAEAAETVIDKITNLQFAAKGVAQRIAVELFPAVIDITEGLTEWIVRNRELIQVRVMETISATATAVRSVYEWFQRVIPATRAFIDSIGGLRTVGLVLAGLFALILLPAIVAIGAAVGTIGGILVTVGGVIVAALGPAGLAMVALTAGLTVAAGVIKANWDAIRDAIVGTITTIIAKARGLIPSIPAPVRRLFGLDDESPSVAPVSASGPGALQSTAISAANAATGAAADVGGTISIELLDGRARIKSAETNNPGLELDLAGGEALAPA